VPRDLDDTSKRQVGLQNAPALATGRYALRRCWTGGQGTLPYEQNTQQSPACGRNSALQLVHS
jgi:hypothetical protein